MRRWAVLTIVFIVGFVLGAIFLSILSMKASKVYLEMVRLNYIYEQEELGKGAWKKGDLQNSFYHYYNVVQAISEPGIQSFNPAHVKWSFDLPFSAVIVNTILKETDKLKRGKVINEGIHRGILGLILETMGRYDEAQQEYIHAANLMKIDDIEKVRKIAKKIIDEENKKLSLPKTPSGQEKTKNDE